LAIKFGTSGWREIISDGFTFDNVRKVTQAVAGHIRDNEEFGFRSPEYLAAAGEPVPVPSVVVGYDTRFLSEQFARETAEVLAANGVRSLFSSEEIPTPTVAWAVLDRHASGGVTITASHNPPEWNGYKWTPYFGGPATPAVTADLERRVAALHATVKLQPFERAKEDGFIEVLEFRTGYLKRLRQLLDPGIFKRSKLHVAADAMHGAARRYLRPALEGLGVEVTGLREERDVLFGGLAPTPEGPALEPLRQAVLKGKLDLGLACDGDADRFGVLDSGGNWIPPNEVLGLVLDHLVRNRGMKGKIARSVMTSHFVDAVAKSHGLTVRETPVGFKFIGDLLRTGQYLIGGEESGGLSIMGHVPEKDGILACLLLAEMVAADKKPLAKIRQELKKRVGEFYSVRLNLKADHMNELRQVMSRLSVRPPLDLGGNSVWRIDQTDGFKFLLRDGSWLGLRPSGTEPMIRVYAESQDKKRVDQLIGASKDILKGKF
jgi:alpha-D-glucose phosphate-specific phosphoglucomutase